MLSEELLGRADLPRLVVVSVAITGSILLMLNILLVGCFMYRKRRQRLREGVLKFAMTCSTVLGPAGGGFAELLYMCYWHSSVMWCGMSDLDMLPYFSAVLYFLNYPSMPGCQKISGCALCLSRFIQTNSSCNFQTITKLIWFEISAKTSSLQILTC